MLFVAQGFGWVDGCDAKGWDGGGDGGYGGEEEDYGEDGGRVVDFDSVEDAAHGAQGCRGED